LNEDFGLDWYDYGARWYDASIGRWNAVDALSDAPEQIDKSVYAYGWNNPVSLTDPDGNCPNCITGLIGAGVGALVGGGVEIVRQIRQDGKVTNWKSVGGSALQGGITGGAAGLTGGTSLLTTTVVSGSANVVGGAVNRNIQGKETTVGDVVTDAAIGVGFGAAGHVAGNLVKGTTNNLSRHAKGNLGEAISEGKYALRGYKSGGKAVVKTGRKTPTGKDQVAKYDHDLTNVFTGKKLTVESKFNKSPLSNNQKAARSNITTPGGLIVDRTTSEQLGNTVKVIITGSSGQIKRN
jgi:RHS repeat-associated protein